MFDSLPPHGLQHAWLPCPSLYPRVYLSSCSMSQWCHPTISSSVIPFSSPLQSFPPLGSFPRSQFFASGGQSIRASASVLPKNIQDWFPLGWAGLISLQPKGLSRVSSSTTIWKHQFFDVQILYGPTLTFVHNYWENHSFDYPDLGPTSLLILIFWAQWKELMDFKGQVQCILGSFTRSLILRMEVSSQGYRIP